MTLSQTIFHAEEPSRELDAQIAEAVGLEGYYRDARGNLCNAALPYTTCVTSAATLVPEEWCWGVEQGGRFDTSDHPEAWCWPYDSSFDPDWRNGHEGYRGAPDGHRGCAINHAMALCVAALKAREQTNAMVVRTKPEPPQDWRERAYQAEQALAELRKPYLSERASFMAPADRQHPHFILRFDDADRREAFFDNEVDARLAWKQYAPAWNCQVYATMRLDPMEEK